MINLKDNIKEIIKREVIRDLKDNVRVKINSYTFEKLNHRIASEVMGTVSFNIELPISNQVNDFSPRGSGWQSSFIKLLSI